MGFIRLTLVPLAPKSPTLTVDVLDTDLVLSQGQFQPVQVAPTITLTGVPIEYSITPFDSLQEAQAVTNQQTQEAKVIFRMPVDTETFPDPDIIVQPDPTGGTGVFGITLNETRITFAPVTNASD